MEINRNLTSVIRNVALEIERMSIIHGGDDWPPCGLARAGVALIRCWLVNDVDVHGNGGRRSRFVGISSTRGGASQITAQTNWEGGPYWHARSSGNTKQNVTSSEQLELPRVEDGSSPRLKNTVCSSFNE